MVTGKFDAWCNPAIDYHPIQRGIEIQWKPDYSNLQGK